MQSSLDVLAIGHAIVDVLTHVEEAFLKEHALTKDSMALIEEARAEELYNTLPAGLERSGGSAANTAVGVASFGGKAGFIGKVKQDQLGKIFAHDIRAAGVAFQSAQSESGPSTGRCLVMITPDAHRTMATYLGAAGELTSSDIDEALIASAEVLYIEGYLWDRPQVKEALRHAMERAHHYGRKVAFSLSDAWCVDRHKEEFLTLIDTQVDLLFANEAEITQLYGGSMMEALTKAAQHVSVAIGTRGAQGSLIMQEKHCYEIPPVLHSQVVDTTGAGDAYASGFLYGFTRNYSLPECGLFGSRAASDIIREVGARPNRPFEETVLRAAL